MQLHQLPACQNGNADSQNAGRYNQARRDASQALIPVQDFFPHFFLFCRGAATLKLEAWGCFQESTGISGQRHGGHL
jgi:hypothetical protein